MVGRVALAHLIGVRIPVSQPTILSLFGSITYTFVSSLGVDFSRCMHLTVIAHWKRQLVEGAPGVLGSSNATVVKNGEELMGPRYKKIGQLEVEND